MEDRRHPHPIMDLVRGGRCAGYGPQVDMTKVPAALKQVAKSVKRKPTEARYLRTRSGQMFGVSASTMGRALDVDATAKNVVAALSARAAGTASQKARHGQDHGGRSGALDGRGDETRSAARHGGQLDHPLPTERPQRVRRQHHDPRSEARRHASCARARCSTSGTPSARSASGRAIAWAVRSSAVIRSRARRSPVGSARRRPRCSTPRPAAVSRS